MEVTSYTQNEIRLEDNPWLERTLMMVFGVGGIILLLSTMNQHGFQAWYRFTFQVGAICGIGGITAFLLLGYRSFAVLDLKKKNLSLTEKKGVKTLSNRQFPLSHLTDVRLDRKTIKEQQKYRISVQINSQEWLPLSQRFGADLPTYEASGRKIQGLILSSETNAQ
ncbi:MAG: hypothetical protein AAF587_07885 [Bacteroidota bacterium]